MKSKGFKIFIIIIVLTLLAVSCVLIVSSKNNTVGNFFDNLFDEVDSGSNDETTDSDVDSSNGTVVQSRYINDDGYGYQTVGGQTFFFKCISFTDEQKNIIATDPNVTINLYVPADTVPYSSFELVLRWSYDGILWQEFSETGYNENTGELTSYHQFLSASSVSEQALYVSYTVVDNCANPVVVLNDLISNVFTDGESFMPDTHFENESLG